MDYDEPQNVGHIFLALKPDLFISRKEFNSRMKTLGDRVHAVPLAHEFEEILMPGELEQRLEDERRANGIPYNADDVDALQKEAAQSVAPALEPHGRASCRERVCQDV